MTRIATTPKTASKGFAPSLKFELHLFGKEGKILIVPYTSDAYSKPKATIAEAVKLGLTIFNFLHNPQDQEAQDLLLSRFESQFIGYLQALSDEFELGVQSAWFWGRLADDKGKYLLHKSTYFEFCTLAAQKQIRGSVGEVDWHQVKTSALIS